MERDPLLATVLPDGSVELSQGPQVDQTATTHDLVEVQMTRHPEEATTTEMNWPAKGSFALLLVVSAGMAILSSRHGDRAPYDETLDQYPR